MKSIRLSLVLLGILMSVAIAKIPRVSSGEEKIIEFYSANLCLGWLLNVEQLNTPSTYPRIERERLVAIQAFHYWYLRELNLIPQYKSYERLIRQTFIDKKLSIKIRRSAIEIR